MREQAADPIARADGAAKANRADTDCTQACKNAYGGCVQNCSRVLVECLANAKSDGQKDQCKERFRECMRLCKEAQEICLEACGE